MTQTEAIEAEESKQYTVDERRNEVIVVVPEQKFKRMSHLITSESLAVTGWIIRIVYK